MFIAFELRWTWTHKSTPVPYLRVCMMGNSLIFAAILFSQIAGSQYFKNIDTLN